MANQKAANLPAYQNIPLQTISGDFTSTVTNIYSKDNICIQLVWDGTLAGSFDVQISNTYSPNTELGSWDSLPLSPPPQAAGSPDSWTIDINELAPCFIRVFFDYTSGTGNLTSTISGKAL